MSPMSTPEEAEEEQKIMPSYQNWKCHYSRAAKYMHTWLAVSSVINRLQSVEGWDWCPPGVTWGLHQVAPGATCGQHQVAPGPTCHSTSFSRCDMWTTPSPTRSLPIRSWPLIGPPVISGLLGGVCLKRHAKSACRSGSNWHTLLVAPGLRCRVNMSLPVRLGRLHMSLPVRLGGVCQVMPIPTFHGLISRFSDIIIIQNSSVIQIIWKISGVIPVQCACMVLIYWI